MVKLPQQKFQIRKPPTEKENKPTDLASKTQRKRRPTRNAEPLEHRIDVVQLIDPLLMRLIS